VSKRCSHWLVEKEIVLSKLENLAAPVLKLIAMHLMLWFLAKAAEPRVSNTFFDNPPGE
jgi:hypothetical protein